MLWREILPLHEQVCVIRLCFERYFSHHWGRWWEKYLSKRSLIKHTCSRRVNLLYYEQWTDKQKYFYVRNITSSLQKLCKGKSGFVIFADYTKWKVGEDFVNYWLILGAKVLEEKSNERFLWQMDFGYFSYVRKPLELVCKNPHQKYSKQTQLHHQL